MFDHAVYFCFYNGVIVESAHQTSDGRELEIIYENSFQFTINTEVWR